jgi:hypothetical protein
MTAPPAWTSCAWLSSSGDDSERVSVLGTSCRSAARSRARRPLKRQYADRARLRPALQGRVKHQSARVDGFDSDPSRLRRRGLSSAGGPTRFNGKSCPARSTRRPSLPMRQVIGNATPSLDRCCPPPVPPRTTLGSGSVRAGAVRHVVSRRPSATRVARPAIRGDAGQPPTEASPHRTQRRPQPGRLEEHDRRCQRATGAGISGANATIRRGGSGGRRQTGKIASRVLHGGRGLGGAQADAVQRQVLAGSVYPEALAADGTLSSEQMRQVAHSLAAVKFAAGGNRGTAPDLQTPVKKTPPPAG